MEIDWRIFSVNRREVWSTKALVDASLYDDIVIVIVISIQLNKNGLKANLTIRYISFLIDGRDAWLENWTVDIFVYCNNIPPSPTSKWRIQIHSYLIFFLDDSTLFTKRTHFFSLATGSSETH